MLKRHWRLISIFERIGDNAIIVAVFFLAYALRDPFIQFTGSEYKQLAPLDDYLILLGVAIPLYNLLLNVMGGYRSMRFTTFWRLARITLFSSLLVFLSAGSVLYLLKLDLSRSFIGIFCGLSAIGLLLVRYLMLKLLRYFRARGKNFRNLLVVGTGPQARKVFMEIARQPELGVRVAGFVSVTPPEAPAAMQVNAPHGSYVREKSSAVHDLSAQVIATPETYERALKKYMVDEVIFTEIHHSMSEMEAMAAIAVEEGVTVTLAVDFFSLKFFQSDISYFGSIPLIHYQASPGNTGGLAIKRLIDVSVSSVGLVLLSPFLLCVAAGIRLDSPGPVFFRQKRVGLNGRKFRLLKFRSMELGAEKKLKDLEDQNEMTGPVFKIKDDPRVTPLGKFLRRYSIDELPQLINVLKGEMSLVGPRPPLPKEVSLYVRKHRRRLSMRPGITCTWQVSGRNNIPDFDDWAALDLEYIDNWSLMTDLKLLLKTIPAVLSGSGAR